MFETLKSAPRLLLTAALRPLQGDRFQPTGFADLGAAVYERPDGKRMLLVESAQSMANRLEATCLGDDRVHIVKELEGLPYVVAKLSGASTAETSSLVEAHRLNSPFIFKGKRTGADGTFEDWFRQESGYTKGSAIDWKGVARAIFKVDPNSLVHGVFMANFEDGRVRFPRAVTAFIEAEDVREVTSGGVKNNALDPSGKIRAEEYDKDVYSNVPYHRTEFVAAKITAYVNLDLALIRGFGLDESAQNLLVALALYKVRRLFEGGLRLRTACDLGLKGELQVTAPENGFAVPTTDALRSELTALITKCAGSFVSPSVMALTVLTKVLDKKPAQAAGTGPEADDDATK